jgi:hypothetical protein
MVASARCTNAPECKARVNHKQRCHFLASSSWEEDNSSARVILAWVVLLFMPHCGAWPGHALRVRRLDRWHRSCVRPGEVAGVSPARAGVPRRHEAAARFRRNEDRRGHHHGGGGAEGRTADLSHLAQSRGWRQRVPERNAPPRRGRDGPGEAGRRRGYDLPGTGPETTSAGGGEAGVRVRRRCRRRRRAARAAGCTSGRRPTAPPCR